MDLRQISTLLIKVAGMMIVVWTVSNIPYYLSYYASPLYGQSPGMFLWRVVVPLD